MNITLISGHKSNWNAGASKVYLHLHHELQNLGCQTQLFNAEDYISTKLPSIVSVLIYAFAVEKRIFPVAKNADVVEVAGNIGWRLFQRLKKLGDDKRPLLAMRLHGLEFLDEQARITQEIAQHMKLPLKYKLATRHWINWQEFKTIELADVVICHSSRDADAIITAGLKPESQVKVYPLGIAPKYISSRSYKIQGHKLLWWGSWIERKGIHYLPHAFALAARENPNLTLTIGATKQPPEVILADFPAELHSRITVLPFVSQEEHQAILHSHDIFLFPSLSEGFGLALLEAMATGMPCITTLTGMYDWLEHGENAYIVPMNSSTLLAKAINKLSGDRKLREKLGTNAIATAKYLSWERFGQQTQSLYEQLLQKSPLRTQTDQQFLLGITR